MNLIKKLQKKIMKNSENVSRETFIQIILKNDVIMKKDMNEEKEEKECQG